MTTKARSPANTPLFSVLASRTSLANPILSHMALLRTGKTTSLKSSGLLLAPDEGSAEVGRVVMDYGRDRVKGAAVGKPKIIDALSGWR